MSGHSHFKTVKATKDANDAKRGKIFSKLGLVITLAAKEKGGDIITNVKLKNAIDKAKEFNMPKDNIERAIKKGTGELKGENLEEVSFEGFGPSGIALIIEGITDNKNRTIGEIKGILNQYNGKLAQEGAVRWMFDKLGQVVIDSSQTNTSKDELELIIIESGALNFSFEDNILYVYTKPDDLERIKKTLEGQNIKIEEAGLYWVAKEEITIDEKGKNMAKKLFEALDENDAVQDIYSNLK